MGQTIKRYRKHFVFSLFDHSVSDQIRKEYFLTIFFLAAPSPNINKVLVFCLVGWGFFPQEKSKKIQTRKSL